MSYTVPAVDDHFTAVETLLATSGIPVDRGVKPDGAGWQGAPGASVFVPYMVVDPQPGGVTSGPASDPAADASIPFDIRCIGATATQAEQVADVARQLLCGSKRLQVPGRTLVVPVNPDMLSPARADQSMGDGQTLFISSPRFRIRTTPS